MDLQLHVTGTFRNWGDLRDAMIALVQEVSSAGKILGADEIESLGDPVVLDLELENAFKLDGLVGYDILFDLERAW